MTTRPTATRVRATVTRTRIAPGTAAVRGTGGGSARGAPIYEGRRRYSMNLGAHMAECDANYARICSIAPTLVEGATDSVAFDLQLGDSLTRVTVDAVERSRYTTLIDITRTLAGLDGLPGALTTATIRARLYHDAQSAEVVAMHNERKFREGYDYPNPEMRSRDEKAQVNRFLGEFLALCLRHGMAADPIEVGR
ncbi:MAG: DUF1249 domain-containing protein [Pseudomonadota bacterium]